MVWHPDSSGTGSHQGDRPPGPPRRDRPWRVEGAPPDHDRPEPDQKKRSSFPPWIWILLLLLLALNWTITSRLTAGQTSTPVPYSFFYTQVQRDNVETFSSTDSTITGTFTHKVTLPARQQTAQGGTPPKPVQVSSFTTQRPAFSRDTVVSQLLAHGATVSAEPARSASVWEELLIGFGPTLLFILLLVWFLRRATAGAAGGGLSLLGRSRAKLYSPDAGPRTTFADVAGIDEVRDEVMEVVDYLRSPDRYRALGASIPKGVLLTGAPGTGKTLLARAVAGEAEVPFFHLSASEFIEMIVGVGASRVRDLFDQAKKAAPAIIFIDELDAVGRTRGAGVTLSGHDEREQTLNQILTEMDGFTGNEGVVVLAATNRPEILDPALLRAGRFDRRVVVNPPDQVGRTQILGVHTRAMPLAPDVNLDRLASGTPGMVGADLKTLVNEAALLAARRRHDQVYMVDFTDALEKVVLGTARHLMLTPEEKERTAYHEAGHALLGMLIPGADRVRKVSIIPRGQALGVTFQAPEVEKHGYSRGYLRGRVIGALGGRAAEELVFGDVTTGAESDLDNVTRLARQMVGRWGMSDRVGPITVLPPPGQEQSIFDTAGAGEATREIVDAEARRIIDDGYADALRILGEHRDSLESLARRLLAEETLDENEAYDAAGLPGGSRPPAPVGPPVAAPDPAARSRTTEGPPGGVVLPAQPSGPRPLGR